MQLYYTATEIQQNAHNYYKGSQYSIATLWNLPILSLVTRLFTHYLLQFLYSEVLLVDTTMSTGCTI